MSADHVLGVDPGPLDPPWTVITNDLTVSPRIHVNEYTTIL
jgi:hypothetical protein